eukprot:6184567-Pleurochrysis_carterae.AAC.3
MRALHIACMHLPFFARVVATSLHASRSNGTCRTMRLAFVSDRALVMRIVSSHLGAVRDAPGLRALLTTSTARTASTRSASRRWCAARAWSLQTPLLLSLSLTHAHSRLHTRTYASARPRTHTRAGIPPSVPLIHSPSRPRTHLLDCAEPRFSSRACAVLFVSPSLLLMSSRARARLRARSCARLLACLLTVPLLLPVHACLPEREWARARA